MNSKTRQITAEELDEIQAFLKDVGFTKVSAILEHYKQRGVDEEHTKHIIRQGLDRGRVTTDAYFRIGAVDKEHPPLGDWG